MKRTGKAGRAVMAVVAATFALAGLSCGDGPTGSSGSIQLAVSSAALSVPQGASGNVAVTLTRSGFAGPVTLAVAGLPTGVTGVITPTQLTGTAAVATLAVTVDQAAALRTTMVTITAAGQGVGQATAAFQLTITAAAAYTITLVPGTLTVPQGDSSLVYVNLARTNFAGAVNLAFENPPAGITGRLVPPSTTENLSVFIINVGATVAIGTYQLGLRGTATGLADRVASVQLTVTPSSGSTSVVYHFCDDTQVPVFLAYQDGAGAWQPVTASTSGDTTTFAFNLTQGRGGMMAVYQYEAAVVARRTPALSLRLNRATEYVTEILYASATELAQDALLTCDMTRPTKTVTGNVVGVSAGSYGFVSFGNTTEIFNGAVSTNPVMFDVPDGSRDLVGARVVPGTSPDRIIVFRNLNIPDGGALPSAIDFDGPASMVPARANVVVSGAAGDRLETYVDVVTANSRLRLSSDLGHTLATTRSWAGLPPGAMVSGDFHALFVFASTQANPDDFRMTLRYVGPVADQTLALGGAMSAATATQVAGGAYPRFRFQGTLPAEYDKGAYLDVAPSSGAGNALGILATRAYLAASGNASAYDFTMPDVSGLAGFPAAARLGTGAHYVAVAGFGFTGPGIFDLTPTLGTEFKEAWKSTTINVP